MFLRPVYWPIWQAVLSIIQPDIYPNENFKDIKKEKSSFGYYTELNEGQIFSVYCDANFFDTKFNVQTNQLKYNRGFEPIDFYQRFEATEKNKKHYLQIENLKVSDTGSYHCHLKTAPSQNISLHLFVKPKDGSILLSTYKDKLEVKDNTSEYVVPCPATRMISSDEVKLQFNGRSYDKPVSYDPRIGFILRGEQQPDTGNYTCTVKNESKTFRLNPRCSFNWTSEMPNMEFLTDFKEIKTALGPRFVFSCKFRHKYDRPICYFDESYTRISMKCEFCKEGKQERRKSESSAIVYEIVTKHRPKNLQYYTCEFYHSGSLARSYFTSHNFIAKNEQSNPLSANDSQGLDIHKARKGNHLSNGTEYITDRNSTLFVRLNGSRVHMSDAPSRNYSDILSDVDHGSFPSMKQLLFIILGLIILICLMIVFLMVKPFSNNSFSLRRDSRRRSIQKPPIPCLNPKVPLILKNSENVESADIGKTNINFNFSNSIEKDEDDNLLENSRYVSSHQLKFEDASLYSEGYFSQVTRVYLNNHMLALKRNKVKENFLIEKEISIHSPLKHPNVVPFIGHTKLNQEICLLTMYCYYGELLSFVRRFKYSDNDANGLDIFRDEVVLKPINSVIKYKFLNSDLFEFALQIVNGLVYLRDQKICHIDFGLKNIMLTKNYICHIADFGLSRKLDETEEYVVMPDNKRQKVPSISPPEVFLYRKFNQQTDIFHLGVTLMHLFWLGVKRPFGELNPVECERVISGDPALYNIEKAPLCPNEMVDMVRKSLNPDPKLRPTAYQWKKLLTDFLRNNFSNKYEGMLRKLNEEQVRQKLMMEEIDKVVYNYVNISEQRNSISHDSNQLDLPNRRPTDNMN